MKVLVNNQIIDFSLVYSIEDNKSSISIYFINTEKPITFRINSIGDTDQLFDESMLIEVRVNPTYGRIDERSLPKEVKENFSDYEFKSISRRYFAVKKTDVEIVNKRIDKAIDEEQKKFEKFKDEIKKEYLNSDKIDLPSIQY